MDRQRFLASLSDRIADGEVPVIARRQLERTARQAHKLEIGSSVQIIVDGKAYNLLVADNHLIFCDGREVRRSDHPQLFKTFGTSFGKPSSDEVFKVPDFRGKTINPAPIPLH